MIALLSLLSAAFAAKAQVLTWDITLNGKPVGQRIATVKWLNNADGASRRVLEVWTEVDAKIIGIEYQFRERLTANAIEDPVSFHAVSDLAGDITEVQARRGATYWKVSVGYNGRTSTRDREATAIDLSTADLLDPGSRVSIGQFQNIRILSAETGEIYEGPVSRLGTGEIPIDGQSVPVEGYSWTGDGGKGKVWYNADGYLVQYEMAVMGFKLIGTLSDPPPMSADAEPIQTPNGVTEIPL